LCWVPIVRGLIWLVTRRCKLSKDGCGSRGPKDFLETGADRRTLSLIFLGRMRSWIGERHPRALGGGTVHRTCVPTCLTRCALRILPRTDLRRVSANISDSDVDKGGDTTGKQGNIWCVFREPLSPSSGHTGNYPLPTYSPSTHTSNHGLLRTLRSRDLPETLNDPGGTTIRGLDKVMTIRTWFDRLQLWSEAIVSDIRKLLFPAAALSLRVRRGRNGRRVRKTLMPFASPTKRTFTRTKKTPSRSKAPTQTFHCQIQFISGFTPHAIRSLISRAPASTSTEFPRTWRISGSCMMACLHTSCHLPYSLIDKRRLSSDTYKDYCVCSSRA